MKWQKKKLYKYESYKKLDSGKNICIYIYATSLKNQIVCIYICRKNWFVFVSFFSIHKITNQNKKQRQKYIMSDWIILEKKQIGVNMRWIRIYNNNNNNNIVHGEMAGWMSVISKCSMNLSSFSKRIFQRRY